MSHMIQIHWDYNPMHQFAKTVSEDLRNANVVPGTFSMYLILVPIINTYLVGVACYKPFPLFDICRKLLTNVCNKINQIHCTMKVYFY